MTIWRDPLGISICWAIRGYLKLHAMCEEMFLGIIWFTVHFEMHFSFYKTVEVANTLNCLTEIMVHIVVYIAEFMRILARVGVKTDTRRCSFPTDIVE